MAGKPAVSEPPSDEPGCRRVLVAEKDAAVSLDLTRTLTRLGYTVPETAQTAEQAIEMALRNKPALVLMDIRLEGLRDGIEAASELRNHMDVPVVFATACADAETVRRALETNPAGFIVKPFSSADLRLQLAVAIARHELKSPHNPPQVSPLQISAIAHDFNNLLTLIMANADELSGRGECRAVEQIRRASQLATLLCRQMLPAATPTADAMELNSMLESNRNLIERAVGAHCQVVLKTTSEALDVNADEGQISRICINLALNARKAMPNGGELRIVTRRIAHSLAQISISDTGIGMDAGVLRRVFDPYFSGDTAGGSGLGLAIVHGIVGQMGGTISVESEPGRGAAFTILLPLVSTPGAAGSRHRSMADKTPCTASGRSVLLVEDQAEVRALVRDHLKYSGIQCIGAANSEEALEVLKARGAPVNLLVTDVSLPGMSGAELAVQCLERAWCSRVLFISGSTGLPANTPSHRLLRERSDFLAKPFTAAEVTARVTAIFKSIER